MTDTLTLWHDSRRPESWAGEIRVNLVRLLAIALFYGRHLIEVMLSPRDSPLRGRYHLAVTMVVIVWVFEAVVLHLWLSRRFYAPWIKYAAVLWDAMMITSLCAIAGGVRTPLVLLYFGLIASAPLRLSLRLVYAATAASMLGWANAIELTTRALISAKPNADLPTIFSPQ